MDKCLVRSLMERKGDSQTLQTKFLLNVSWTISCSVVDGASSLAFRSSLSSSSCLKDIMGREVSRLSPEETTDDTAERGGGEGEEEEEEDEKEEEEEEEEDEESVGGFKVALNSCCLGRSPFSAGDGLLATDGSGREVASEAL